MVPGLEEDLMRDGAEGARGDTDNAAADDYMPGHDLEPRRKPVTLSPSFPRLVYELDEEDIQSDLDAIRNAVKVSY